MVYSIGDILGFLAVGFIGISAIFMALRGKISKVIKKIWVIRYIHIGISILAGIFLIAHIAYFYGVPLSTGKIFGYASFGAAILVWLSGMAFLEKLRGSLQFHGSLTIILISLALIHASFAAKNFPVMYSVLAVCATAAIVTVNTVLSLKKI
jgi:hypothetical protein